MINLTCQRTHILAWINSDSTLSLKLNGIKYLAYPKVDKRGEKYWKVDGLVNSESKASIAVNSSLSQKELELVKSYQEKVANNYKMEDFSLAESRAFCKWRDEQERMKKQQEQITSSSQKVADELTQKVAKNHETNPQ